MTFNTYGNREKQRFVSYSYYFDVLLDECKKVWSADFLYHLQRGQYFP